MLAPYLLGDPKQDRDKKNRKNTIPYSQLCHKNPTTYFISQTHNPTTPFAFKKRFFISKIKMGKELSKRSCETQGITLGEKIKNRSN